MDQLSANGHCNLVYMWWIKLHRVVWRTSEEIACVCVVCFRIYTFFSLFFSIMLIDIFLQMHFTHTGRCYRKQTQMIHSAIQFSTIVQLQVCNTLCIIIVIWSMIYGFCVCMCYLACEDPAVSILLLFYSPLQAHYCSLMAPFSSFYSLCLYGVK